MRGTFPSPQKISRGVEALDQLPRMTTSQGQNWGYPAVGKQMPILSFAVVGGVAVAVTADEIPHPEFFRNSGFLAELNSALETYIYPMVMYSFHVKLKEIIEPATIYIQTTRQFYQTLFSANIPYNSTMYTQSASRQIQYILV